MSYRVTQGETTTSAPEIIEALQRFTGMRNELHEVVHLNRTISDEEKDKVCQIGCAIVDQTLLEGPSASAIKNELSIVLSMTYEEHHALYAKRNKVRMNSNSTSLLDEKIELQNKVADLEKTVKRKDEKICQLMDFRAIEGQNDRAEVVQLTKKSPCRDSRTYQKS